MREEEYVYPAKQCRGEPRVRHVCHYRDVARRRRSKGACVKLFPGIISIDRAPPRFESSRFRRETIVRGMRAIVCEGTFSEGGEGGGGEGMADAEEQHVSPVLAFRVSRFGNVRRTVKLKFPRRTKETPLSRARARGSFTAGTRAKRSRAPLLVIRAERHRRLRIRVRPLAIDPVWLYIGGLNVYTRGRVHLTALSVSGYHLLLVLPRAYAPAARVPHARFAFSHIPCAVASPGFRLMHDHSRTVYLISRGARRRYAVKFCGGGIRPSPCARMPLPFEVGKRVAARVVFEARARDDGRIFVVYPRQARGRSFDREL